MSQYNVQLQDGNGSLAGLRNQLMNGSFIVRQRMAVGTPTNYNDNAFVEDRWAISSDGGTAVNGVEVTVQDSNSGPLNQRSVLRVRQGTATATTAKLTQPIELNTKGDQFPYQVGTQWTLSFWYSGSTDYTTQSCRAVFRTASGVDTNQLLAAPNTTGVVTQTDGSWNKYAFTFTINGNMSTAAGQANFTCLDIVLNNFDITSTSIFTEVQFEPGPVATPFELRPIALELELCQRYYQSFVERIFGVPVNAASSVSSSVTCLISGPSVTFRVAPTVISPPSGFTINNISGGAPVSCTLSVATTEAVVAGATLSTAVTVSAYTQLRMAGNETWALDAEF